MKKIKEFINRLRVPMTAEQEAGYEAACAKQILNYANFFLFAIIAFQLYNIIYTLIYTNFRLHTMSSRVYTVLYTVLLIVCLASVLLVKRLKKQIPCNYKKVMFFQTLYGIFIILWAALVTAYDQRVSENMNVYLIISLTVAVLVYFKPIQSILTYGIFQFILLCLLPVFKDPAKDSYGVNVNLTIMTLMCIFISIYHNCYSRKHYLYQQIIIEKNSHLKYLANRDTLTGLRNRRFLEDKMDRLYGQCLDEGKPLTFMMLDIDSFKDYNDRFGHTQGDECLRRVSWRISSTLKEECEYLIRYGGEEFLYIGVGIDEKNAQEKAEHFNKIIRELITGPSECEPMGITISIGACTVLWNESDKQSKWTDFINKADKALYKAKNSGKDKCICIY